MQPRDSSSLNPLDRSDFPKRNETRTKQNNPLDLRLDRYDSDCGRRLNQPYKSSSSEAYPATQGNHQLAVGLQQSMCDSGLIIHTRSYLYIHVNAQTHVYTLVHFDISRGPKVHPTRESTKSTNIVDLLLPRILTSTTVVDK